MSNYAPFHGVVGHEFVNEIIVDRLLSILGIEHLSYQLVHMKIMVDERPIETWLCASCDFKRRGESKVALDASTPVFLLVSLQICIFLLLSLGFMLLKTHSSRLVLP